MKPILVVGNKNYSSWSLRPWLCLRWAGIEFDERVVRLDQPGYGRGKIAEILAVAPSGKVPALQLADGNLWDSLAIAEWAAEESRSVPLWPAERLRRGVARAVTCEMHSGFAAMRRDLSMNIRRRVAAQDWAPETRVDIERVIEIWSAHRAANANRGSWLFGERSIADAFFTPVATRFRTYSVALPALAQSYCDTLLDDADFKEWEAAAVPNSWDRTGYPVIDKLYVGTAQDSDFLAR